MRLLAILESQSMAHKLKVGWTSYDVDLDESDGSVQIGVSQHGMSIAEMTYEGGEIVWIHVEPFFRKQGIGTAMVEFLKEQNYRVPIPEAKTPDGVAFFKAIAEDLTTVQTHTPEQIAKKHGVDVDQVMSELRMGIKVEAEHTTSPQDAREIALDHLLEFPDYYTRLADMESNGKSGATA